MAEGQRRPKFLNFRQVKGTKLYRTSNLNKASESIIEDLKSLGITSLVDLRSDIELLRDRNAPLGNHYLKLSTKRHTRFYTLDASMRKDVLRQDEVESGRHKFGLLHQCDFVDMAFVRWCLWQSPWYMKPIFALRYLIDVIFYGYVNYSLAIHMYRINRGTVQSCMTELLDVNRPVVNDVLRLLCAPANDQAALMCSSGKDRTGIISALVQTICGVDRETIIADFAQSDAELAPVRQRILDHNASFGLGPVLAYAPPEAMSGFLNHIDKRYGSIPQYLESIGFCSMMQEKLRQNVRAEHAT